MARKKVRVTGRVTRGCQRKTIDFPQDLHDRIMQMAEQDPKISFAEWVRRVCAHHCKVDLPPAAVRKSRGLTLAGDERRG